MYLNDLMDFQDHHVKTMVYKDMVISRYSDMTNKYRGRTIASNGIPRYLSNVRKYFNIAQNDYHIRIPCC